MSEGCSVYNPTLAESSKVWTITNIDAQNTSQTEIASGTAYGLGVASIAFDAPANFYNKYIPGDQKYGTTNSNPQPYY